MSENCAPGGHGKEGAVRLKVYANARQGGRNYMEDFVRVYIDSTSAADGGEIAYLGVFDGHGGPEAARLANTYLSLEVARRMGDWTSDEETTVVDAIRESFAATHRMMRQCVGTWPRTPGGLPSTAGTTASLVVVRADRLYVAHVGDSAVVLGNRNVVVVTTGGGGANVETPWIAECVTVDHKPDSVVERRRIEESGGQVAIKAGVARVVWTRPRCSAGEAQRASLARRSGGGAAITSHVAGGAVAIDNVPFLAVARSLGDLWSYNAEHDAYVVSPEPDVSVHRLDSGRHRCVILASDGVWNVVTPRESVQAVQHCVQRYRREREAGPYDPAARLVQLALDRWAHRRLRADNASAVVALLRHRGDHAPDDMFHPAALLDFSSCSPLTDGGGLGGGDGGLRLTTGGGDAVLKGAAAAHQNSVRLGEGVVGKGVEMGGFVGRAHVGGPAPRLSLLGGGVQGSGVQGGGVQGGEVQVSGMQGGGVQGSGVQAVGGKESVVQGVMAQGLGLQEANSSDGVCPVKGALKRISELEMSLDSAAGAHSEPQTGGAQRTPTAHPCAQISKSSTRHMHKKSARQHADQQDVCNQNESSTVPVNSDPVIQEKLSGPAGNAMFKVSAVLQKKSLQQQMGIATLKIDAPPCSSAQSAPRAEVVRGNTHTVPPRFLRQKEINDARRRAGGNAEQQRSMAECSLAGNVTAHDASTATEGSPGLVDSIEDSVAIGLHAVSLVTKSKHNDRALGKKSTKSLEEKSVSYDMERKMASSKSDINKVLLKRQPRINGKDAGEAGASMLCFSSPTECALSLKQFGADCDALAGERLTAASMESSVLELVGSSIEVGVADSEVAIHRMTDCTVPLRCFNVDLVESAVLISVESIGITPVEANKANDGSEIVLRSGSAIDANNAVCDLAVASRIGNIILDSPAPQSLSDCMEDCDVDSLPPGCSESDSDEFASSPNAPESSPCIPSSEKIDPSLVTNVGGLEGNCVKGNASSMSVDPYCPLSHSTETRNFVSALSDPAQGPILSVVRRMGRENSNPPRHSNPQPLDSTLPVLVDRSLSLSDRESSRNHRKDRAVAACRVTGGTTAASAATRDFGTAATSNETSGLASASAERQGSSSELEGATNKRKAGDQMNERRKLKRAVVRFRQQQHGPGGAFHLTRYHMQQVRVKQV